MLEQAAAQVGLELVRDQTTYEWFQSYLADSAVGRQTVAMGARPEDFGKSLHVLRLKDHKPGDYEIGVKPALDGNGFRLEWDQWGASGNRLTEALGGTNAPKLMDAYNEAVTIRALVRQGYRVRQEVTAQGQRQVIAQKG